MQSGPTIITKYICNGCSHLIEKYWTDYLENDEIDSGVSMNCELAKTHITNYGPREQTTPNWCPLLPEAAKCLKN